MTLRRLLPLMLVLASAAAATSAFAQTPPSGRTIREAERMLRGDPALMRQLQEQLGSSGMTLEQIRARLRASGYSASLLDPYFSGSANAPAPSGEVFDAIRDLGLADARDLEELRKLAGLDENGDPSRRARVPRALEDSLHAADSTLSDESAEIFGLSLFRSSSSEFLPNVDGPVDAGYRLGPGDEMVLTLSGDVEDVLTAEVSREGTIVVPRAGSISVANLTLGEAERLLRTRLGRVYSGLGRSEGASTRLSVGVSRLRSNQVFVTGDVMRPGSYRVTSAGTVLTALYAAGGPADRGSLRRVEVRRGGQLVGTLDVYDYLRRGDASRDVRLQQGDIVFVPVASGRVRVDGHVRRPATYEVLAGETLGDVIDMAGGLRATAAGRRLAVERIVPLAERSSGRDRMVLDVPVGADGRAAAVAMADGDLVRVPGLGDRVRGRVQVNGHVWTPGLQGFTPGLTLQQALQRAGGTKPDAYLGTVLISRLNADSVRVQLRARLRDTTGVTLEAMPLAEDDEITVFSRSDFRPERYVAIGGAVKKGGRFRWQEGMTLRDLVLLGGGLTERALLREAEIARVPADANERVTAQSVRVPLDSSYRFEASGTGGAEIALQPYDNVLILPDPTWREPAAVTLTGEVRFPGRYTLLERGERLASVIARAGGLTAQANADGAHLARVVDSVEAKVRRAKARQRRRERVDMATIAGADSMNVRDADAPSDSAQRDSTIERIRVGVDVRRAVRSPRSSADLPLADGDSLHLPVQRLTVEVRGEVNEPTAVMHSGRRLGAYVRNAGGATDDGRVRSAYVIQPNGLVQTRRYLFGIIVLDPQPLPGAVVVVPERTSITDRSSSLATLSAVTQVLASLATIIIISRQ